MFSDKTFHKMLLTLDFCSDTVGAAGTLPAYIHN